MPLDLRPKFLRLLVFLQDVRPICGVDSFLEYAGKPKHSHSTRMLSRQVFLVKGP
jgi:hypothetical protein